MLYTLKNYKQALKNCGYQPHYLHELKKAEVDKWTMKNLTDDERARVRLEAVELGSESTA